MRACYSLVLIGLFLLGASASAVGARMDQLYVAEVASEDLALLASEDDEGGGSAQSESEKARRQALMRAALARVLIRLTGNPKVLDSSMIRAQLLDQAPSLVSRFQYLERGSPRALRIRVAFSPEPLRSRLWEAGWRVWGPFRPDLLIWTAARGRDSLKLASPDAQPKLYRALQQAAHHYGLPLRIPLMDGVDRRRLNGQHLLFEDWGAIEAASQRYGAQAILLLRLTPGGEEAPAQAEWVLRNKVSTDSYTTTGASMEKIISAGLRRTLARLASRYAVSPDSSVTMRAVVEGVSRLADYARVERAVGTLTAVEDMDLLAVEGDQARFRFRFRGRPRQARPILSLTGPLEPVGASSGESDSPLRFTFRP